MFIIPILGMMNCSGWNEGSMTVESCLIDAPLFRDYANLYYNFMLFSALMGGIPIIIYVFLVFLVVKLYKNISGNNAKIFSSNTKDNISKIGWIILIVFLIILFSLFLEA
jgi:hypothetical protein